jgi:hypothetical protein
MFSPISAENSSTSTMRPAISPDNSNEILSVAFEIDFGLLIDLSGNPHLHQKVPRSDNPRLIIRNGESLPPGCQMILNVLIPALEGPTLPEWRNWQTRQT